MLSIRDSPRSKTYTQTKSKGMEKDISCKWKGKKAGVAVLLSDKMDFKTVYSERHRRTLHNDKGAVHQENITLVNTCAPNTGAPKCRVNLDGH